LAEGRANLSQQLLGRQERPLFGGCTKSGLGWRKGMEALLSERQIKNIYVTLDYPDSHEGKNY